MMKKFKKPSFLERLSGSMTFNDNDEGNLLQEEGLESNERDAKWMEEEAEEGQLTVDVYQMPNEIIIKSMVAGVEPQDLEISITRDMVTLKGKRQEQKTIMKEDYFFKELYWGSFSRTILLPAEIDPDGAEASERHGLLTIRLPKLDKNKTQQIKVKAG